MVVALSRVTDACATWASAEKRSGLALTVHFAYAQKEMLGLTKLWLEPTMPTLGSNVRTKAFVIEQLEIVNVSRGIPA